MHIDICTDMCMVLSMAMYADMRIGMCTDMYDLSLQGDCERVVCFL